MIDLACLHCGYSRTGIEPTARCPECGEHGLDDVIVGVRGWEVHSRLITGLSIAFYSSMCVLVIVMLFAGVVPPICGLGPVIYVVVAARAYVAWRRIDVSGGDILWLLRERCVTVVDGSETRDFRYDALAVPDIRTTHRGRRMSVTLRGAIAGDMSPISLSKSDPDVTAFVTTLESRIAMHAGSMRAPS